MRTLAGHGAAEQASADARRCAEELHPWDGEGEEPRERVAAHRAVLWAAAEHARRVGPPAATPARDDLHEAWASAYADYMVGRGARIQASAQSWLSVVTSLISFFSAALVLGSPAVNDLAPLPARITTFLAAGAILLLAVGAVVQAALASFGRLSIGTRPTGRGWLERCASRVRQLWTPADPPSMWTPEEFTRAAQDKDPQQRKRLHRSRLLGLAAAIVAAALSLAILAWRLFVG